MRILQVTARYYPELQFGGPPQKIHDLSRGLVQRGHQVQIVTLHSGQHSAWREAHEGIDVCYLSWIGAGTWQVPLGLSTLTEEVRRADVIHCYGLYNLLCPAAACLADRRGRPVVLEPLGMYVPRTGHQRAKRLYHGLITSRMVERAAKVIATSPTESEELADLVETERLVLRRNGIDLELFRHLPRGGAFRADHGIEEGERIILYLGRISPIKNLEQLVQAFGQADLDRARLVLGGPMLEAGYARRLGALISDLDLANRVSLVGPLYGKAKLSALAAADLFVLPSLFESYGLAAAEAVAAGVPVLLTETCGLAMQIHERAGLAVPVGVSELSRGLQILLEDVEQRARLTCRRDELLVELSWEGPLSQTEELYACLVR